MRLFEIAHRGIDSVLLLPQQRGIEPGGGIARIQPLSQFEFLRSAAIVVAVLERFAQVTAQNRPLRFERDSGLQIFQATRSVACVYPA